MPFAKEDRCGERRVSSHFAAECPPRRSAAINDALLVHTFGWGA